MSKIINWSTKEVGKCSVSVAPDAAESILPMTQCRESSPTPANAQPLFAAMIEIARKEGKPMQCHSSFRSYRQLAESTAVSFAPGIDAQNRKAAYFAEKARERRAREKEFTKRLIQEVTNVRQ